MVLEPAAILLLVRVSVVSLPTKVSVAAGRVSVPEAVADALSIVVPDVEPLKVIPTEPIIAVLIVGEVSVLFVRV